MKNTIGKSIKVDPELYHLLKELAIKQDREIKTLVDRALRNFLKASKALKE